MYAAVNRTSAPGARPPLAAAAGLLMLGSVADAQSIEPRAFSNAPVGVNFLVTGYTYTRGALFTDPSLPITNADFSTSGLVVGYTRVLDLWGRSSKVDMIVPYAFLSGTAKLDGETVSRRISGNGDPGFRLSVNLYGAPALGLKEFTAYRQDLIVGASLRVTAPWSQYDRSRVVNIGTNRWTFKPEVGVSKAVGHWTLEAAAAITFFTDNDEYYGGNVRSQDPLHAVEAHTVYTLRPGAWASLDATYYSGGRSKVDDSRNRDLQRNWRVGATLAIPLSIRNSVKFYASSGVWARTGNNFEAIGVAWQYRWGGGL
jgi:hypothetical protein